MIDYDRSLMIDHQHSASQRSRHVSHARHQAPFIYLKLVFYSMADRDNSPSISEISMIRD